MDIKQVVAFFEKIKLRDGLIGLFVLFFLQFLLFRHYILREISPFTTVSFDQTYYLMNLYSMHDRLLGGDSFFKICWDLLGGTSTGFLYELQSLAVFMVIGASRFTALLPNLFYFFLEQLAVFLLFWSFTKKVLYPFLSVALFLLVKSTFSHTGGIADFRLDFLAFALFGIFLCACLASDFFAKKKWIFPVMLLMATLACFRFYTLAFTGIILFSCLFFSLVKGRLVTAVKEKKIWAKRSFNIFLTGAGALIIVSPVFWLGRKLFYAYYSRYYDFEAIKVRIAEHGGITDRLSMENILFYPKAILNWHFGSSAGFFLGLMFLIVVFCVWRYRKNIQIAGSEKLILLFLGIAAFWPTFILTTSHGKHEPAIGFAIPTLIILSVFIFYLVTRNLKIGWIKISMFFFVLFVFFRGVGYQVDHYNRHSGIYQLHNSKEIVNMYLDMGKISKKNNWKHPVIGFDRIIHYLGRGMLGIVNFEHAGFFIPAEKSLAEEITPAITKEEIVFDVGRSHFVIFSETPHNEEVFPMDASLNRLRTYLKQQLHKKMNVYKTYYFDNKNYQLYVRKM